MHAAKQVVTLHCYVKTQDKQHSNSLYSSKTWTISSQWRAELSQRSFCTSYILGTNIPRLVQSPIHSYRMDHALHMGQSNKWVIIVCIVNQSISYIILKTCLELNKEKQRFISSTISWYNSHTFVDMTVCYLRFVNCIYWRGIPGLHLEPLTHNTTFKHIQRRHLSAAEEQLEVLNMTCLWICTKAPRLWCSYRQCLLYTMKTAHCTPWHLPNPCVKGFWHPAQSSSPIGKPSTGPLSCINISIKF